jgi:hypothetical protein
MVVTNFTLQQHKEIEKNYSSPGVNKKSECGSGSERLTLFVLALALTLTLLSEGWEVQVGQRKSENIALIIKYIIAFCFLLAGT